MDNPIYVKKTQLPDWEAASALLRRVWEDGWVTNGGKLCRELEERLRSRFDAPSLNVVGNGTISLQLLLKMYGVRGSVITTPFSYVATTNVLLWADIDPIFVDIDAESLCLDPSLVEEAIREDTTAILATHVYGRPCDHEALQDIAARRGLKLIYDAAHAFDVTVGGESILKWGDGSAISFHATKVFHSIEGGAIVTKGAGTREQGALLRSFGHVGRDYRSEGINAKLSELHAAVGLLNLPRQTELTAARRQRWDRYQKFLAAGSAVTVVDPTALPDFGYNYAYFPILFPDEAARERTVAALESDNIFPRRYFEPSLNELPFLAEKYRRACPVSESAARRVLCLPLYADLPLEDVDRIARIVTQTAPAV